MSLIASPVPGSFTAPQLVTLADVGSDAVFYTVDGSVPQYAGYTRDWNDGLLGNQTNTASNGTATFTNPGTFLRQTLTGAATSASSFLDSAPIPGFPVTESRVSVRVRFNSGSCNNDTSACVIYRCAGKFSANDTYGYVVGVSPRGGVFFGRGSNTATGAYTALASAPIPAGLAYDTFHTLTVTVRGLIHTVSVNGVVLANWQDSTYLVPGYVGVRTYAGSAPAPAVDYDDFGVEFSAGTRYTEPVPVVPATTATTIKALSVTGTTPSSVSDFVYTLPVRAGAPIVTVVDKQTTLTLPVTAPPAVVGNTGTFTDSRDGKVYKTIYMPDGNWWFAENLAWSGAGLETFNAGYTAIYGRQYRTVDAAVAAPAGSRFPTYAELSALTNTTGNSSNALKAVGGTYWLSAFGVDTYGFGMRGAGSYNSAGVWQSDLTMFGYLVGSDNGGCRLRFAHNQDTFSLSNNDPAYGSVRCIVTSGNVPDNAVAGSVYYTTDGSTPVVSVAETYPIGSTGTFTDSRDGKVYKTVLMPDQKWWSAENLAWSGAGIVTGGRHHYFSSGASPVDASVVPVGTHIPAAVEWSSLSSACGGDSVAGARLRAVGAWPAHDGVLVEGTDNYGFNAAPSGYVDGVNNQYEWDYGAAYAVADAGSSARALSSKVATLATASGVAHYISVRFIVDSGNVPDPAVTISGTLYTGPFPFKVGQVVCAVTRTAGYLDSLPVRLYPADNDTGVVVGRGYISTQDTQTYISHFATHNSTTPYLENPNGVTFSSDWLKSAGYRFYGDILQTPPPPTTGTASTKQQRFFADEGIQISVFPRQPTVFNSRVDWGNGPVTNRSLKITWRVPQNEQFLFGDTKTAVSKLAAFGDLDVVSQSDTWAIGGASATAELAAPELAHYLDVNASLGFISGIAQTSQAVRVTGGRNSAPSAIWLSPGAGNARLNIPIDCVIQIIDVDLDSVGYTVSDGAVTVASGTTSSGQILFTYVPAQVGTLQLTITLIDPFNFQTVVPAPTLTVLANMFPVPTFVAPASGTAVYAGEKTTIEVELSDAEAEDVTWQLLRNHNEIAHGTTSSGTGISYKYTVPAGPSQIGIVVADPLGAAPEVAGPMIYGTLCKITDVVVTGHLQGLQSVTLTPTLAGTVSRVDYAITTSQDTTNLSSSVSPFTATWSIPALPNDQDVTITASAYDSQGYYISVTKSVHVLKANIAGTMTVTESSDAPAFVGHAYKIAGTVEATESSDVPGFVGNGQVPVHGIVAGSESVDIVEFTGVVRPPNIGSVYAIEATDTCAVTATNAPKVTGSVLCTEQSDTFAGQGTTRRPVFGNLYVTESPDVAVFLAPPPPGTDWTPYIEFIEIEDAVDVNELTRVIADAFSPYQDVVEFVVEIQRVTTPDPETDPSPWTLLRYVDPIRV